MCGLESDLRTQCAFCDVDRLESLSEGVDMILHVNLSVEMEMYIRKKVASGVYRNASELIHDALRRTQADEDRVLAWKTAMAQGDAKLDRGEGGPLHTRGPGRDHASRRRKPCGRGANRPGCPCLDTKSSCRCQGARLTRLARSICGAGPA